MSDDAPARIAELEAENARLKAELKEKSAVAIKALATFQSRSLQMEIIRQQNDDLKQLAASLDEAKLEADKRSVEQRKLVALLEAAVLALSAPILQIWAGVLMLPVLGTLDNARSSEMTGRLLETLGRTRAQYIIIDVTGVESVDSSTADHLIRMIRAVELMGAKGVVTGIKPAVAQTITSLGVDLSGIAIRGQLQEGLRLCIRSMQAPSA
jgi:anti-anti-sigma factor